MLPQRSSCHSAPPRPRTTLQLAYFPESSGGGIVSHAVAAAAAALKTDAGAEGGGADAAVSKVGGVVVAFRALGR
jgi:hypothetical protein